MDKIRLASLLIFIAAMAILAFGVTAGKSGQIELKLAATSNIDGTDLLEEFIRRFKTKRLYVVEKSIDDPVVVKTVGDPGRIAELLESGEIHAALLDDPETVERLLGEETVSLVAPILSTEYVIVGPSRDPAGIKDLGIVEAAAKLAGKEAPFVAARDGSSTGIAMRKLLAMAKKNPWYQPTDLNARDALKEAIEKKAYALADLGTALDLLIPRVAAGAETEGQKTQAQPKAAAVEGKILSRGKEDLRDEYSFVAVNPEKFPGTNYMGSDAFMELCRETNVTRMIANFNRNRTGESIYRPAPPARKKAG